MSNPSEPDDAGTPGRADDETEQMRVDHESEPATEIIGSRTAMTEAAQHLEERRFTAPSGFDGSTQKFTPPSDPETEVFAPPTAKAAVPQTIPPRDGAPSPPAPEAASRRSWGWVIAVVLVIAALVAIAILGTVLLTRNSASSSQEDKVRTTIENFDAAVQRGDLAALRSITCGSTRDNYVNYDQRAWDETHARVTAAKQYPVVSSIDQVVVNHDHAEANVTTFMAFAPQTRSTRSFDLQFRDDQWKICQAPAG
jgi:hypothetical protein